MTTSLERARLEASEAAARAGVTIREVTDVAGQTVARRIFDAVWPADNGEVAVTSNLLRALVHAGGYCVVAEDQTSGRPVGATLAFVGREASSDGGGLHLHSHMAAVHEGVRDRSIGTAMKVHQRWWALENQIPTVVWTFDPLVRRNARLNLMRLGVEVGRYYVDFYGEMPDAINAGDPTDRLLARWDLASTRVSDSLSGRRPMPSSDALVARGAAIVLTHDGELLDEESADECELIAVPPDIVALRRVDPNLAQRWRICLREAMEPRLSEGAVVDSLTDDGYYVVRWPREGPTDE
jgi:predicted GNAT superfamily acetyltransferase